jgi:hypothetical protein
VHYYILNLNARELKHNQLVDKNMPRIRLNFAPHAYLWPQARFGQEIKINILSAIYTSQGKEWIHSSLRGIDECNDFGRISINPGKFFYKGNSQEVHLHQSDDHNMAVSPNNGAFLLNLTMPVVNFHLVMSTLERDN